MSENKTSAPQDPETPPRIMDNSLVCPKCGYNPVAVQKKDKENMNTFFGNLKATCPMCMYEGEF